MLDCVPGGILNVFETVAFEFDAAKPAGDRRNAICNIFFLQNAQDDDTCTRFPIITLCFINRAVMTDSRGPAVVVGFGVLLVGFESFEESFDVFPALDAADGRRVAATAIFDDHRKECEWRIWLTSVAEVELSGLEGHIAISSLYCIIIKAT